MLQKESRFSLGCMNCYSPESQDVPLARRSLPTGEKGDHTLSVRGGGGRHDSDGGSRQTEVYMYVGEPEKDRQGSDETLRSGSRSHRVRKESAGLGNGRRGSQRTAVHIPLCEVLSSRYSEELNFTEPIALTLSKCTGAVTGCSRNCLHRSRIAAITSSQID